MCNRSDSQDGFDADDREAYEAYGWDNVNLPAEEWDDPMGCEDDGDDDYPFEDDGQPSEYEEWQDLYGGDDFDHGQFDNGDY